MNFFIGANGRAEFLVGGNLNNGANDGSSCLNLNNGVSNANWNIAARDFDELINLDSLPHAVEVIIHSGTSVPGLTHRGKNIDHKPGLVGRVKSSA